MRVLLHGVPRRGFLRLATVLWSAAYVFVRVVALLCVRVCIIAWLCALCAHAIVVDTRNCWGLAYVINYSAFRFMCPAIVSPVEMGIIAGPLSSGARRGLIMASKIIQQLSNGDVFGDKEERKFMCAFAW